MPRSNKAIGKYLQRSSLFLNLSFKDFNITYETKYSRMDQVKFFKGCLLQILLGPFLNTLSHIEHLFSEHLFWSYESKIDLQFQRAYFLYSRFIKAQSRETLKILTGKKHPQINFKAFKKLEYGHLGGW